MGKFAKDRRDIFYRKAKQEGWRARSAYKLLQLDDEFDLLGPHLLRAVDLCAAPGSWSQVLSSKLWGENEVVDPNLPARIVAVDLQEMTPIHGVRVVQGDITSRSTAQQVVDAFGGGKAQLVVSDGAPDVTGMHDLDEFVQAQLLIAALNLSTFLLEEGGMMVAKIFRNKDVTLLYAQFEVFFTSVVVAKPMSSRNSSAEAFVVCRGFHLPQGFTPSFDTPLEALSYASQANAPPTRLGPNRNIARFISCGDLDGPDPNKSHALGADHEFLPPVHPPIKAAYEGAVQSKRKQ